MPPVLALIGVCLQINANLFLIFNIIVVYDSNDVRIAFALELRDEGEHGFQLPPDQITAASEETWAGIRAVIDRISRPKNRLTLGVGTLQNILTQEVGTLI